MSVNEQLAQVANSLFPEYSQKYDAVEVISLATTDGFPVYSHLGASIEFDADKMAAASSTLYSISNAVARQILSKSFRITFIEAEQGNVAFVSITLQDKDFVLALSAGKEMNVGQLRVIINRLAEALISAI